ncbi:MAG: insulinase family protein [Planctomycetes bacterium]|nr:insulinase family protein [Planctomycetota bacterium]
MISKLMKTTCAFCCLVSLSIIGGCTATIDTKNPKEIASPPLRKFEPPKPERIVLKNGIIIYILEDHQLPLIGLRAEIRAGSIFDPDNKVGLSEMAADVLRSGGAKTKTGDAIDEELESKGASIEFWSGHESVSGYLSALNTDFNDVLRLFADILMAPQFDKDKIDLAKVNMKSSIARRNDDATGIAFREFNKLIFGAGHPLARTTEIETINAINRDDLVAFHKQFFCPNNLILGVWGDFNKSEIVAKLQEVFNSWDKKKDKLPEFRFESQQKTQVQSVSYIEKNDLTQSTVLMGNLGITKRDPDYVALEVANTIFGGAFSSRLFKNVRSAKGLAYSVWSSEGSGWTFPGSSYMACSTKSPTTIDAITAMNEELKNLCSESITDEELRFAKDSILNSFVFQYDSKQDVIERYVRYEQSGYSNDFAEIFQKKVSGLTKDDILQAVKRHYQPDKLTILVVGKKSDFGRPLETLGQVNVIPLEKPKAPTTVKTNSDALNKGRDLIRKVIRVVGSPQLFKNIKSVSRDLEMSMESQMGKMKMKGTLTISLPDKLRLELDTPMGKLVQVLNKDEGWQSAMGNTMSLQASEVIELKKTLDSDFLLALKNLSEMENPPVQFVGEEEVDGKLCNVLEITEGNMAGERFFIESNGNQIYQTTFDSPEGKVTVTSSEYKEFEGFSVPTKYKIKSEIQSMEMSLKNLRINPDLEPTMFEKKDESDEGDFK